MATLDARSRRLPELVTAARRADVVQTWLYHADLTGGLAARLARRPVAWNLRQSDLAPPATKPSTRHVARACAVLSRVVPAAIVCASDSARRAHERFGYAAAPMVVIPNGVPLPRRPGAEERAEARRALGLDPRALVVGRVGRFDPQKDHRTFVAAAALLAREMEGVQFVLCGSGVDSANHVLVQWLSDAGLLGRTALLGERRDIDVVHAALDVACSSSSGEAFPNVVAEAMAMGIAVAATDAGDTGAIVGDAGIVVPVGDAPALADALAVLSSPEVRHRLGARGRARIAEHYSVEAMAVGYTSLWERLVART